MKEISFTKGPHWLEGVAPFFSTRQSHTCLESEAIKDWERTSLSDPALWLN